MKPGAQERGTALGTQTPEDLKLGRPLFRFHYDALCVHELDHGVSPVFFGNFHPCVDDDHVFSSTTGLRHSRHRHPHVTLTVSPPGTERTVLRRMNAAPCREC